MKKRGFTLVELMGVIIILGVIGLIAIPTVRKVTNESKEKLYKVQISNIKDGLKNWATTNSKSLPQEEGQTITITLGQLKMAGFIDNELKNPKTNKCFGNDMELIIKRFQKNYIYEVNLDSGTEKDTCDDYMRPYIMLNGATTVYVEVGEEYKELGAIALDELGNDITNSITTKINETMDTSKVGNKYIITYTVTTDNNTESINRTVIVRDTKAPIINVPPDIVIDNTITSFDVMEGVSVTDNSGETISVSAKSNISFGIPGEYTITYTAKDSSGNVTTTKRKLVIEKKYITISFDANGGTVTENERIVICNTLYANLPIPKRDGYLFTGWALEQAGKEIISKNSIIKVTENHTLYAQWNAKSYMIRYHGNGGIGNMTEQIIKYDAIVALSKNTFTKDDYAFFGWAITENGDKVYNDMDSVVNLKADGVVDLYAIWKQNSHTVTFDYNGGTGSTNKMEVLYGQPYGQLPDYPYLKDHLFAGWYTEKTGGTQVHSQTTVNKKEAHILYAHWETAPSNDIIRDLVVKNVPDKNGDGVMDAIYLSFKCASSFEKYNIPLKNLVVGQKYKLSFKASNNAEFGTSEAGYKNSMYGSIITNKSTLDSGSIKEEAIADGGLIAQWSDRTKGNTWLNGPFEWEMTFVAEASTMYWTWDFGLMTDYVQYDFNFTDIILEPVAPEINFANKKLVLYSTSDAKILNDVSTPYSTSFVFDGASYAETVYYSITGLTAGATYSISFNHKYTGALIDDSSKTTTLRYDYGFGIMNSAPTKYASFLNDIGTLASNKFIMDSVTGNTNTGTLTFTATGNTAYWVWNMANCSDSINNSIELNVTNFSVTHTGGKKFIFYNQN